MKNDDKNISKNPNNITDTIKNNDRKDGIELKIINEMTVINNNNGVERQIYNNDNKNTEKEILNNMTGCINNDNDISYYLNFLSQCFYYHYCIFAFQLHYHY